MLKKFLRKSVAIFLDRRNIAREPERDMAEPRPVEQHFVRDYKRMVAAMKETMPLDDAMSLAVGGNYDLIGGVERAILEYFGLAEGMSLLDLGCGSGRLSSALSYMHIKYIGTDIIPDLLAYARLRAPSSFKFELATGLAVSAADSSLDMACAFSVFTHLRFDESYVYLQDLHRALKPGGTLVFSFLEFAAASHWSVFEDTIQHTATGAPQHLNQFIERDVISLWAKHIGLKLVCFVDADAHPWGERPLGQAIVVLKKLQNGD